MTRIEGRPTPSPGQSIGNRLCSGGPPGGTRAASARSIPPTTSRNFKTSATRSTLRAKRVSRMRCRNGAPPALFASDRRRRLPRRLPHTDRAGNTHRDGRASSRTNRCSASVFPAIRHRPRRRFACSGSFRLLAWLSPFSYVFVLTSDFKASA